MRFSLPSTDQVFGGSSQITSTVELCSLSALSKRFDHRALGSSRKLGGAGKHLIDGSEQRICRLRFEF